ncbi:hypothetical protein [Chryseolinea sp. H1M3-3]|uniref:hypothetical protein n=1 Tax=Chryseolinea sp. H1M3-3 TaxID=3034144 RepID=UPI0023ECB299|nr:hypothetical protein [Chryseolinea sp. H1M3-3]
MKGVIIFLTGVLALASCERDEPKKEKNPDEEEIKKSEKNIAERFLRLDGTTDTLRGYELGKNLFGKFHKKRAEFYVIEHPNKTIYNRPVKCITLYFLDGTLAKTKYELEEDISDDLIHSYGNFTIKGYDTLTRTLLKSEKVIHSENQKKVLNKNLTNYELKWDRNTKFIYTRVDKSTTKKRFEYIEALKDYNSKYKRIEAL